MASWIKKEILRLGIYKRKRLVGPSVMPQVQEVVFSADLGCSSCQQRVADAISNIHDVESMVVHVVQKKVAIACKIVAPGSLEKVAV
ncbi:hypothetical protein Tsubulata_047917 [Turnera subulata]|uniref:HMA domain-containing protein n=1 Tax=Turnera subulata TaxID=218843 RepID=A0A9Q0G0S6_9ROSI|nr:hypothetical protein Tsubulata_047917 [Turnera subulata]